MLKDAIFDDVTSTLISTVRDKIISSIKEEVVFNPTANLVAPDVVLDLLKKAFSVLKQSDYFSKIPNEDLERLFFDNIELIRGWIFNAFPVRFTEDAVTISNYDCEKECKAFLKGLYNFIVGENNRYNYPIVGFTNVSNQVRQAQNNQNLMMAILQDIQACIQINLNSAGNSFFENELVQIDNCIKARKYTQAITLLDFIKDPLLTRGTNAEKEKFYICYSSIYLQQMPLDRKKICGVLSELLQYSQNETDRLYRTALLYIYEDKTADALKIVEENTSKEPDVFFDIKAYILFTLNKYDELLIFLSKASFVNKNVWLVRALLNTHKVEQAYAIIQENKKEFEHDFETKFLNNHVCCYYLLGQKDRVFTDSLLLESCKKVISDIDSAVEASGDDTYLREELLCDKMMLELLLGNNDIKNCLEELEKIGSKNPNYLRNKALYDLTVRDFKKAYEEFDAYCKEYPDDEVAKELWAIALFEYNPELAIKELGKLEDTIKNIPQKIKIVYAYFVLYRYEDGFKIIEQLEKNAPESFYVHNAYGDYYCSVQKHGEAFKSYSKAINCQDGEVSKVDTFGRMMQIAICMQDPVIVGECIKKIPNFSKKALLECYAYELISLFLIKMDFDSALKYIEEYKKFFDVVPRINYLELLCYNNSGSNEKVVENYNFDNTGLVEEQVQQKLKMLVGAYQKKGDLKKAHEIFHLLNAPKTDDDFVERIRAAKSLGLEKECLQYVLNAYKKYPNSFRVIEELLSVFTNRKDHTFDNDAEACAIFDECLAKYSAVPEEERNLLIFISPFMIRKKQRC